jgi:hypothetical protein
MNNNDKTETFVLIGNSMLSYHINNNLGDSTSFKSWQIKLYFLNIEELRLNYFTKVKCAVLPLQLINTELLYYFKPVSCT